MGTISKLSEAPPYISVYIFLCTSRKTCLQQAFTLDSFFTPSDWTRHDCTACRVHQKMVNSCRRARHSGYLCMYMTPRASTAVCTVCSADPLQCALPRHWWLTCSDQWRSIRVSGIAQQTQRLQMQWSCTILRHAASAFASPWANIWESEYFVMRLWF